MKKFEVLGIYWLINVKVLLVGDVVYSVFRLPGVVAD
jgi:hypothetical protein